MLASLLGGFCKLDALFHLSELADISSPLLWDEAQWACRCLSNGEGLGSLEFDPWKLCRYRRSGESLLGSTYHDRDEGGHFA